MVIAVPGRVGRVGLGEALAWAFALYHWLNASGPESFTDARGDRLRGFIAIGVAMLALSLG